MQSFPKIIEGGYTYVDKTQYIKPLLSQGEYIFLSRPRRFGKSLFVSTLKSYFEGRRDLFKELAADSMDLDWTPTPVLRFDFNAEDYSKEERLEQIIDWFLRDYEEKYGRDPEDVTISQRFKSLIQNAYQKTGRKVVILVDEYDKPLIDIQEYEDILEKNQRTLKSFFGNLKSMDDYIRFAFITGVTRFNKVSIFSDFNNLDDISMEDAYSDICGWTEKELLEHFKSGIETLAKKRKEDFPTTLEAMREYYDGYLFSGNGSRLYNPYSVLKALKSEKIRPSWYETGTPTFLARWVKGNHLFPFQLNHVKASEDQLVAVGFDPENPVPLMFQAGYLTIESFNEESELYTLGFPNKEVEYAWRRVKYI